MRVQEEVIMRVQLVKWIVSLGLLAALALMAMACGSDEKVVGEEAPFRIGVMDSVTALVRPMAEWPLRPSSWRSKRLTLPAVSMGTC